jgi:hypothetical protein
MAESNEHSKKEPRKLGGWKGKVWLAEDWDSDETNEEIARDFYAEDDELDPVLRPPDAQA